MILVATACQNGMYVSMENVLLSSCSSAAVDCAALRGFFASFRRDDAPPFAPLGFFEADYAASAVPAPRCERVLADLRRAWKGN